MTMMYKFTITLALALAFAGTAHAQLSASERASYKKVFVKSCVTAFMGNFSSSEADDDRLQQIADDYCDCSADKVIDYYADDIGRIDEMTENQAGMIAKKCVTAMETAVKQWTANGRGSSGSGNNNNNSGGSTGGGDRKMLEQELQQSGPPQRQQQQERPEPPRRQQQEEEGEDNRSDRDKIKDAGEDRPNNNNNNRSGSTNHTLRKT